MLQFTAYKKHYNGRLVLQIDELTLPAGLYWLKGGNGSGKSTLLKSVAGIIPFEGDIRIAGVANNARQAMEYRRLVNYGEAEPAYPEFLAGDDLLQFYREAKNGEREQMNAMMERLGVQRFAGGKMGTYSSGMLKKLSLVLAFTGRPQLILLDEPLVTLDKEAVSIVNDLIREHLAKGISILFTSHQDFNGETNLPVQTLQLDNGTTHV